MNTNTKQLKQPFFNRSLHFLFIVALMATANSNTAMANAITLKCDPGVHAFICNGDSYVSGSQVTDADVNGSYSFEYEQGGRRAAGEYNGGVFDLYSKTNTNNYGYWQHTLLSGSLRLDDLIISGPGSSVSTSMNLQLSGSSIADIYSGLSGASGASVGLDINVVVAGSSFSGEYKFQEHVSGTTSQTVSGIATQIAGGGYDSTFSATLVTPFVEIDVGEIFAIDLSLGIQTSINYGYGFARMGIDWFSPLVGQQVFNLAEGYTVNSVSGLIVDNCFLECDDSATVTEPSEIVLIMSGILGLGLYRRRIQL